MSVMAVVQFGLAMMPLCHDHAAGPGRDGREFLRNPAAGAEQRNVNVLERVLRQFGDGDVVPAKFQFLADGARRRKQGEFAHRKISFFQCFDHFDADGARRADHGHMRISIHKSREIYQFRGRCQRAGGGGSCEPVN